jgi:uncharacterized protein (TIGR02246 family)
LLVTKGLLGIFVVLSVSAACAPSSPPAPPAAAPVQVDAIGEIQSIRDVDARWLKAAQSGDAAAESVVFAPDGVAYREHLPPLVGPAGYRGYAAKFRADNPKASQTWATDNIQVSNAGDIAIQTGEYHLTGLGPNGTGEDRGRFVTVWKKVKGEWKVAHDIGSTTMPEAAPVKK